jgi:phosphatidylinositol alpha-1,6-mannosyltransferase
MSQALLLTPTFQGNDGISCLARQLHAALATISRADAEVISLEGGRPSFVSGVLGTAARPSTPQLAVVAHLHLLPAVWPLLWRGTKVVPVLVGIESWTSLTGERARVLRRLPRAIAISHHTEREFKRANPDFANLPVDVCWPAAPALPIVAAREQHDSPFALIVGRMAAEERYKGHDELIEIWPRVRETVPGARLVIAGTGDDVGRLQTRVECAGLVEAVTFERHVSGDRLAALYRDCAFVVLPSRREGFGYVLLEAMRAGRACIGGRGAAEEIIEPGVTGLVVDPAAAADLTNAVVALFNDPALRTRMGAAGRQRAERVFTMSRFTSALERALAQC